MRSRSKQQAPFDESATTGITYEGLCKCIRELKAKIERDKYVRYYAPVWIVKHCGLFAFRPMRIAWYRLMNRLWLLGCFRKQYSPHEVEQMKAWGK